MSAKIIIRGARQHNLKNIDLELPRNQLIVFTGVSGSGKFSLAQVGWAMPTTSIHYQLSTIHSI